MTYTPQPPKWGASYFNKFCNSLDYKDLKLTKINENIFSFHALKNRFDVKFLA